MLVKKGSCKLLLGASHWTPFWFKSLWFVFGTQIRSAVLTRPRLDVVVRRVRPGYSFQRIRLRRPNVTTKSKRCGAVVTTDSNLISQSPVVKTEEGSEGPSYDRNNLPLGALLTGAKKLHDRSFTGKNIRVGVIDSGIDADHPGFDGMVKKQVWYRDGSPLSEDDHGTHVAGTIHFMAPDAELYDYRVFGAAGKIGVDEAVRRAILQAIKDKCHVINMSLGSPTPDSGIHQAIKKALEKDILCVCAAGNSGDGDALTNEPHFPAQYDECVSIAAVSKEEGLPVARFSSSNIGVDHSGIGVNVISFKPGGGVQGMSGTSMACPHVCGFIAALLSEDKTADVRKRLVKEFSIDIGVPGPDKSTGLGFVSALEKAELVTHFSALGMEMAGPKASVY